MIRIGDTSDGTVNQTGGTFDAAAVDNVLLGANAGAVGTYNLNGGTLIVKAINQGAGTANFNFDGGMLQAAAHHEHGAAHDRQRQRGPSSIRTVST